MRNTPTTCSQGPWLWTEDVILAPKPLALSLPRDFSVLTRDPVNRTFRPNQLAPPTPFWGPCPGKVFQAFPGQWVPPWSLHHKVLEVALKHRLLAPPPQLMEVCSGAENWHSDSSPGCRCWPWDLTLRTAALGGSSLSNLPILYLNLVFPKLQPLAHPLPQALPTFLPSPYSTSYFLFLFVGSLWEFIEIYIKKGTFRTSWWCSG